MYSLTILNLISAGLIIYTIIIPIFMHLFYSIYYRYKVKAEDPGWGGVVTIGYIYLGIVSFVVDLILQFATLRIETNIRFLAINIIEVFVLIVVYYFTRQPKFIIKLPEGFMGTVGIVYKVPNMPKLKKNIFTLNTSLKLPQSRLIFTQSKVFYYDRVMTEFVSEKGRKRYTNGGVSDLIEITHQNKIVIARIFNISEDRDCEGESKILTCKQYIYETLKSLEL